MEPLDTAVALIQSEQPLNPLFSRKEEFSEADMSPQRITFFVLVTRIRDHEMRLKNQGFTFRKKKQE